jgi:hypothetical protein
MRSFSTREILRPCFFFFFSYNASKLHRWHVAYILTALNPVFLIVNILILALEVCSVSVVVAGTTQFCKYVFDYLQRTTTTFSPPSTSTTTTGLPTTVTTSALCNFVFSTIDELTNETVTYSMNTCTTTMMTTSTSAAAKASQVLSRLAAIVAAVGSVMSSAGYSAFRARSFDEAQNVNCGVTRLCVLALFFCETGCAI